MRKVIITITYMYIITGFVLGTLDSIHPMMSPVAFKAFTIPYIVGNFAGRVIIPMAIVVSLTCLVTTKRRRNRLKS